MKDVIEQVVKETDRVLFSWMRLNKYNSRFKISPDDVKSLFHNWFTRMLKSHIGYAETSRLLHYTRPAVTLSEEGWVNGIRMVSYNEYRTGMNNYAQQLSIIFKDLDYLNLAHQARKLDDDLAKQVQEHLNRTQSQGEFDPKLNIDLTTIKNIQFL